jgi:putative endopeptidase
MGHLLKSWDNEEGGIPYGVSSLLQIMLSMNTPTDIASRIGWMNRYGITPPLLVYKQGDPRNHKRCCIFIEEGEPQIGSPDFWEIPSFSQHRKHYKSYIQTLSKLVGVPVIEKGYPAEQEFASVMPTIVERRTKTYRMSWRELCSTFRYIDWTSLLNAWGLETSTLPTLVFNVTSPAFLHHLQQRILHWSIDKWRGWLALLVVQWLAGCSPPGPLRSAWFKYNRIFLQGVVRDETPVELRNSLIRTLMPNTLGKLWVRNYCDGHVLTKIHRMIKTIQAAAVHALNHTSWMAPATKKTAIRKLQSMDLQVGWPSLDAWKTRETSCTLDKHHLIGNLLSLSKLSTDENQKLTDDCRHPNGANWGKSVFEVNAYYYPDENRLILPISILRPPFYDSSKSDAWNFGAIGATIGHEMCHAFDSDGRLYDENGDKRDWWTGNDDREYRQKANQVVRLFDNSSYRGLDVDGELTLIENIADLGGLEFALEGLIRQKRTSGAMVSIKEMREFFTAFAVSWRTKDRIQRAGQLLVTDMHSPPKLRVDNVVRQFDAWYTAFDITQESHPHLWIHPTKRIHFFA